jgi:cytochrome c2
MRSLSNSAIAEIGAGALFVLVIIAVAISYAMQRERTRSYAAAETGGDPRRGEAMFIQYGCGSCHALKNVREATGMVGPPLDGIALRVIIAGHLANNPANMQKWIRDPQHVSPGTAMPDLHVGEGDARDIAAFLYTRAK